jgi:hypothetical protein
VTSRRIVNSWLCSLSSCFLRLHLLHHPLLLLPPRLCRGFRAPSGAWAVPSPPLGRHLRSFDLSLGLPRSFHNLVQLSTSSLARLSCRAGGPPGRKEEDASKGLEGLGPGEHRGKVLPALFHLTAMSSQLSLLPVMPSPGGSRCLPQVPAASMSICRLS